jgi:lysophospholipase L1-like esterase
VVIGGVLLPLAIAVLWQSWPDSVPDVRRASNLAAPGDLVAFFGDSITQGFGVRPEESFPALVARALGVPMVNVGVPGDTMGAGLARMERDVLPHRPRLVVVEFGGNDFLRRVPREETLRDLEAIVGGLVGAGTMVVLLEVNVGLGGDPYLTGFQAVADRHGAVLIPDIMRGILSNPDLKADTIHPNARGHRRIADRLIPVLRRLLQEADRHRSSAGKPPEFSLPGFTVVG